MKKQSKRLLTLVLSVIMVLSILPIIPLTVSAKTDSGKCGKNLTWEYNGSTHTLTISGTGKMYGYDYDEDDFLTTAPWGLYYDTIKTAVIKNGVTSIGDWAFGDCTGLKSITVPNSVKSIGDCAFRYCWFESITIPDSVTSIGNRAFAFCGALKSITIPDSVTSIGDGAFDCCTGLKSVTVGNSVTSIGDWAFANCGSLNDVYYTGTEQQKANIYIDYDDNDYLLNATWHYNVKKYNITYKLNGGKNNSENPKNYTKFTNTINLKKPTRKGYTFKGWYSGSKKVTKIAKGSTGKITLTAKWSKDTYKITYKLAGGKKVKNPTKYTVTSTTIKLKNPTRKGYTFKGWYNGKKKVTTIKKGSIGNITLTAKWAKK